MTTCSASTKNDSTYVQQFLH